MKKLSLLLCALMITGVTFACDGDKDKKCKKDCSKAKTECSKKGGKKACCKKGGKTASADTKKAN